MKSAFAPQKMLINLWKKLITYEVMGVNIMKKFCRKRENFVTIFLLTNTVFYPLKQYVRESENECFVGGLI